MRVDLTAVQVAQLRATDVFVQRGDRRGRDGSTIDGLIERSSLGTPGAKALRERTPQSVVDEILRRAGIDTHNPPTQWVELADAKCETCGGEGLLSNETGDPYCWFCSGEACALCYSAMQARERDHDLTDRHAGQRSYLRCPACGGSGAPTIELWAPCPTCGGRGRVWYDEDTPMAGQIRPHWTTCAPEWYSRKRKCGGSGAVLVARCKGVTVAPAVDHDDNETRPIALVWGRVILYDGEWQHDIDALDPLPTPDVDFVIRPEQLEWL